jgi:hypothetical protein
VKIKPRICVQVVKYSNDEVTTQEDAFQMDDLIDLDKIAPSTELEKDLIFHVVENTYVHIDTNELNELLSTSGHTKVDEDEANNFSSTKNMMMMDVKMTQIRMMRIQIK